MLVQPTRQPAADGGTVDELPAAREERLAAVEAAARLEEQRPEGAATRSHAVPRLVRRLVPERNATPSGHDSPQSTQRSVR